MGIKIVREPSETPNINNTDDFVPFRYAYGNQDGYVIGKGNEVNIEQVDTNSVLIKSGRFVVQGVEVDVDANGIPVDFDDVPQNSDVFVTVYAEVSLATNSVNMQKVFDTVDYPVVEKGDDLTHITNGTANIEIAHIKLSNGAIVSINKIIKPIEYNLGITKDENGVLRVGDTIIPQKKLLWSGEINIGTDTTDICSIQQFTGSKTIEVHLIDRPSSNVATNFILKLQLNASSDPDITSLDRTTYVYDIDTDIYPYDMSWMEITLNCNNFMLNGYCRLHGWSIKNGNDSFERDMHVTKVYEIIE